MISINNNNWTCNLISGGHLASYFFGAHKMNNIANHSEETIHPQTEILNRVQEKQILVKEKANQLKSPSTEKFAQRSVIYHINTTDCSNMSPTASTVPVIRHHHAEGRKSPSSPPRRASAFSPYPSAIQHHQEKQRLQRSPGVAPDKSELLVTSSFPNLLSTSYSNILLKSPNSDSMSQQMCSLKWNDHEFSVVERLSTLYKSSEFTDVTLSCEGQTIRAHKLILAMCSPFFRKIFQESPCKHPFVIVNGMKLRDLQRVIKFIYIGYVSLNEDEIDDFIDAAESLKIDGVNCSTSQPSSTSPASSSAAESPIMATERDSPVFDQGRRDDHHLQRSDEKQYYHNTSSSNSTTNQTIPDEHDTLSVPYKKLSLAETSGDDHDQHQRDGKICENEKLDSDKDKKNAQLDEEKQNDEPDPRELKFYRHNKYRQRLLENFRQEQIKLDASASNAETPVFSSSDGRRSTGSSSISSGETMISNKMRQDDSHFEQISPSTSPRLDSTKSIRLSIDNSTNETDPVSPVDMSCRKLPVFGPILPPPPWYSPPSKSTRTTPPPLELLSPHKEHAPTNISLNRSPIQQQNHPENNPSSVADTDSSSRIHHPNPSHRHSISHVYGGSQSADPVPVPKYQSEEILFKRSISLSPTQADGYELHMPEPSRKGQEYGNSRIGNLHSDERLDRRWTNPTIISKRNIEPNLTSDPRIGFNQSLIAIPNQLSINSVQFHPYGPRLETPSSNYLIPHKSTTSACVSVADQQRYYDQPNMVRNYSSLMMNSLHRSPGPSTGSFHKYKAKNSSTSNLSSLRMRLAGISPSSADSLGSSSTSSSSTSISAGGGGGGGGHHNHQHQQHEAIAGTSSGSTSNSTREVGLNHLHPLLTKPRTKAIRSCQVPQEFRYTAQEVDSMVEQVENYPGPLVPCAVCSKFVKRERLRAHIHECHLLQGEKIICQYCGIALKSKGSYRVHIWRHKRGNLPTKKFKHPQHRPMK